MKTLFLTAIGGDIGYGIIKAIRKANREIRIIGCDTRKYNYSYDIVDKFYTSPSYLQKDKWIAFVRDVIRQEKVDIFWPVTEIEIKLVDENKPLFEGVSLAVNSSNILKIAMDKGLTAQVLKEHGFFVPETWERIDDAQVTFPCVVKERFGCGSHAVQLVHTATELYSVADKMSNYIIQEYVGDAENEYTLAIFSDGETVNSIAFKRTIGFQGMSRFVELVHDQYLVNMSERIASFLSLKGSINVQMRKKEGRYYIFEINPRISSTIGFRVLLGFNDVDWWINLMEGKSIAKYEYPSKKVYGVRNVEEKIFFE